MRPWPRAMRFNIGSADQEILDDISFLSSEEAHGMFASLSCMRVLHLDSRQCNKPLMISAEGLLVSSFEDAIANFASALKDSYDFGQLVLPAGLDMVHLLTTDALSVCGLTLGAVSAVEKGDGTGKNSSCMYLHPNGGPRHVHGRAACQDQGPGAL